MPGIKDGIGRVTEFIVHEDVEEISGAKLINRGDLTELDLEFAVVKALLVPKLIDPDAVYPGNAAREGVGTEVSAGEVLTVLPDAGEEEFAVKISQRIEVDIDRGAESTEVSKVMFLAARDIAHQVADIAELKGNPPFGQFGTGATPISQHILLVP